MMELTPPELVATAAMPITRAANAPETETDGTEVPAMRAQPAMPATDEAKTTAYFPETLSQMADASTGDK